MNMLKSMKLRIIGLLFVMVMSFGLVGFDSAQSKVYDDAGILSSSEESKLQSLCVSNAEKTKIDFIIVTTDDNKGKSAMTYAEDFFMAHEFGYDKLHGDAILLLIDMDGREIWIATSGQGIRHMSDVHIDSVVKAVTSKLSAGNYYQACETFISKSSSYITTSQSKANSGTSSDIGNGTVVYLSLSDMSPLAKIVVAIIGSFIVAVIGVLIMVSRTKGGGKTVNAHTYNNSFSIRHQSDVFINTTVVKHKIEQQSSSSSYSSGSSHTGSSAHTFGGGGGKF